MSGAIPKPDVIIIGSGPAGVSAAWPLVEAGCRVLMLDSGKTSGEEMPEPADVRSLKEIRSEDAAQWKRFLGEDFSALRPRGLVSPKLKVPAQQFVFEDFLTRSAIQTENFQAVGSLARGGLSNVWGAGAYVYDDADLEDFPITRADLAPSAARVAARIGISGSSDDDLAAFYGDDVPLQPALALDARADHLFAAYGRKKHRVNALGLRIGRARNAVLSEALGGRGACALDDMCLWGCQRGAIYNAALEVSDLQAQLNFDYRSGVFVDAVETSGAGYVVHTTDRNGDLESYESATVVLAAGTLGSTRLALQHLQAFDQEIPLYSNPTLALPLFSPRFFGGALPERNFALGQLGFTLHASALEGSYAHGVIFAASGLPASEFIRHLPLSRPAAIAVVRALQPALLVANCFLPGKFSHNRLRLSRLQGRSQLLIRGAYAPGMDERVKATAKTLAAGFRRLGAPALPGGVRTSEPGADIHYAGTLPMRADGSAAEGEIHTDIHGRLQDTQGLYVVDGAVLNQVAAKNPTFSLMANADRIAHHLASRLKAGGN